MTQNKSYETAGMDSLEVGGNSPISGMFTSAIASGKALADDGEVYDSVQTAVDNATGIVFVGEGTFNESVTINTSGLSLVGSGYNTLIDGGSNGAAVNINAQNVTVRNLSVDSNSIGIDTDSLADSFTITHLWTRNIGGDAILIRNGNDWIISNVRIAPHADEGIQTFGGADRGIIENCSVSGGRNGIFVSSDDVIVSNSVVSESSTWGIDIRGNDCIVGGNQVIDPQTNDGVSLRSIDSILFNNRISLPSGSPYREIDGNGNNTTDDNKTGVRN